MIRIVIPSPNSRNAEFVERALPQYCAAVERAGGEPVVAGLELDNHAIARMATTCDAVLLPGSPADVNPEKYGAVRHEKTASADPARDNIDELLLQDAYNMHKPVLGICFGLQSLNVWRSGTLVQHLETPIRHSHKKDEPDARHRVVVAGGSRLGSALGSLDLTVNSSHHQAAESVGDGLVAVAWSPEDRVIEAVEGIAPDHWVIAVQWHPERLTGDPAAEALFRAFIDAARERRQYPRTGAVDFESAVG